MKKISIIIMLAIVFILVSPVSAKNNNGTVCLVADRLISYDLVENIGVLSGLDKADKKLHLDTAVFIAEDFPEIAQALDLFVAPGECDLIIGIGFLVADVMIPFIESNPDQMFTVIDFDYFDHVFSVDIEYDNVSEILFQVDQGGFLAGYLAAGLSETGAVGVYGGGYFDRVIEFMDGYALGVDYYNDLNNAQIDVLGWDPVTRDGLFLNFEFNHPDLGKALTLELFDAGADTVFAVAGATGHGSLEAASERKTTGDNVRIIQPDFDWSAAYGDPDRLLLTSVVKKYDLAVYDTIEKYVNGTWQSGLTWEDLASGGVDIAHFHRTSNQVPGYLKKDLKSLRLGIMDGTIPTLPY